MIMQSNFLYDKFNIFILYVALCKFLKCNNVLQCAEIENTSANSNFLNLHYKKSKICLRPYPFPQQTHKIINRRTPPPRKNFLDPRMCVNHFKFFIYEKRNLNCELNNLTIPGASWAVINMQKRPHFQTSSLLPHSTKGKIKCMVVTFIKPSTKIIWLYC